MTTYTNSHAHFDCAINGIPFFFAQSDQYPLMRDQVETNRQQIDSSSEPGEQSLQSWWYRSQSSFHLGAGMKYYDPIRGNQPDQFRFFDSAGVDVWTKGEVSLLRKTEKKVTQTTWGDMASWSYGGDSGVLYEDGDDLYCYKASTGASTEVLYRGGSSGNSNIWDIDVSGESYFVVNSAGIYKGDLPTGDGVKVYNVPGSMDRGYVRWIKDHLFVTLNNKFYDLVPTPLTGSDDDPGGALPHDLPGIIGNDDGRLMFTHPEDDWKWNAIEPGPDCVFISGYSGTDSTIHGNRSSIYASTAEIDNISAVPEFTHPVHVAELPHGEYILSMCAYLNQYLVLTTTKGVRVCVIGEGGQLTIGPLSIEDAFSYYSTVWGNYVYVTGASVAGYHGLYRLDLSSPVDETGLRFAYAKDVASGYAVASGGYTARVAILGRTGRLVLMVDGSGIWVEHATDLVSSGWLQTGQIRMDTWEDKLYQYLRTVYNGSNHGSITAGWYSVLGAYTALGTRTDTYNSSTLETNGSDLTARISVGYTFTLAQYSATVSPIFNGYQAKVAPTNVKDRKLRLPLLCARREMMRTGGTVTRSTWDRITALEALERTGAVVPYQDFGTGESRNVVVEKVQFVSTQVAQSRQEAGDPIGMLIVELRTVS